MAEATTDGQVIVHSATRLGPWAEVWHLDAQAALIHERDRMAGLVDQAREHLRAQVRRLLALQLAVRGRQEVRHAIPPMCTGEASCAAPEHVHGCYAERGHRG